MRCTQHANVGKQFVVRAQRHTVRRNTSQLIDNVALRKKSLPTGLAKPGWWLVHRLVSHTLATVFARPSSPQRMPSQERTRLGPWVHPSSAPQVLV